jgi:hypothetical protein
LNAKRLALWALAIFAAWWIITSPVQAGHAVRSGVSGASHAAHQAGTAINTATGGTGRP